MPILLGEVALDVVGVGGEGVFDAVDVTADSFTNLLDKNVEASIQHVLRM